MQTGQFGCGRIWEEGWDLRARRRWNLLDVSFQNCIFREVQPPFLGLQTTIFNSKGLSSSKGTTIFKMVVDFQGFCNRLGHALRRLGWKTGTTRFSSVFQSHPISMSVISSHSHFKLVYHFTESGVKWPVWRNGGFFKRLWQKEQQN